MKVVYPVWTPPYYEERHVKQGCLGKVRYVTQWEAQDVADLVEGARPDPQPAEAYYCPNCIGWHWGHVRGAGLSRE